MYYTYIWCIHSLKKLFLNKEMLCIIQNALEDHCNMFLALYEKNLMGDSNAMKCYWQVKNVVDVQGNWRVEFGTSQPPRVTIRTIQEKFQVHVTVQDVLKGRCERNRSSSDNESADVVLQIFARSPKKLVNQCSREIGITKVFFEFYEVNNGSLTSRNLSTH